MKVNVTRKNIREGKPKDSQSCPIYLALVDIFGPISVEVNEADVRVRRSGHMRSKRFDLPWEAKEFIRRFDNAEKVSAFEFEL